MNRHDTMMPRLFPAEAPRRRSYKRLLINVGIVLLTSYGVLMVASDLLPMVRERMEANRAARAIAFRDRISVHPQPTVITTTPTRMVAPSAPATRVKTIPQSYTLSDTRNRAAHVSVPAPTSDEPVRPKVHPKVVPDSDPGWYIFVPPGDAQHKSPDPSAPFARWMQGEGFGSARECERYRQQIVNDTAYERDHNEELSAPYDYKIKLFANAECVSVQDPRLIQTR
jgi:hypothetical protein